MFRPHSAARSQGGGTLGTIRVVLSGERHASARRQQHLHRPDNDQQGKLIVDGWLTNSAVSVNGGTLGGTGYLGSVTVDASGTLAPGDPQGILHLSGNIVLASGAAMDYDLDGVSTDDEVSMPSGSLTFSGQQFSNFGFTWTDGFGQGTYTLVNAQSISGLGSNLSGSIDGLPATLSVQGSGNNQDLVLNVTPEPSTFTLLGVGATGLMAYVWRRRRAKAIVRGLLAAALLASAVSAQASTINVFNMPSGETSLQFVTVGDPGNLPGPATGGTLGSVPYVYKMGTYDVTVGQYCQFLNAVATTGDPYGLYNSGMATDMPTLGIAQTGSPGNGGYSVIGTYSQAANCPIFDVTWGMRRGSATGCKTDSRPRRRERHDRDRRVYARRRHHDFDDGNPQPRRELLPSQRK